MKAINWSQDLVENQKTNTLITDSGTWHVCKENFSHACKVKGWVP